MQNTGYLVYSIERGQKVNLTLTCIMRNLFKKKFKKITFYNFYTDYFCINYLKYFNNKKIGMKTRKNKY